MKMHHKSSSEDPEVGLTNHVTKNGLSCEIMIDRYSLFTGYNFQIKMYCNLLQIVVSLVDPDESFYFIWVFTVCKNYLGFASLLRFKRACLGKKYSLVSWCSYTRISNCYTMACPPVHVRGDNPLAKARGLSPRTGGQL